MAPGWWKKIKDGFRRVGQKISQGVKKAWNWVKGTADKINDNVLKPMAPALKQGIRMVVDKYAPGAGGMVDGIYDAATSTIDAIADGNLQGAYQGGKQIYQTVRQRKGKR